MRKKFIVMAILSILLLSFGSVFAATSQIDNVPGGAGVSYFHATAAGAATLLNIQSTQALAVMVHVTIYDADSKHLIDFNVPLSPFDNWGGAITGNGTNITITPQAPCYFSGSNTGCFTPLVKALPADAEGYQKGYLTTTISAIDGIGGPFDNDPRNDVILNGAIAWITLPNAIFTRTALLNPAAGSAIATNSAMFQDFTNFPTIFTETAANGYDTIADAAVPFLYNCDADSLDVFPSSDDPMKGINIDSWELMLSNNWLGGFIIADDYAAAAGVGDTLYPALGSATRSYWGRYNENPAVPSETTLVTVMPANSGVNHAPACTYSSRAMSIFTYDDNEFFISTPVNVPEVGRVAFGPAGVAVPGTSGEAEIFVDAPMMGFTYTEAGNYADIYPLVKVGQWISTWNGLNAMGYAFDITTSEVIMIGN